jgi:glucose-1-phosphate thymidylyltransferase
VRAVVLAGGRGTRLLPATGVVSKQLLPIYDTPMIFHAIALLMGAGVREFMLISTPDSLPAFRALFGDGSQLGISMRYAPQAEPRGIAEALIIAADFLDGGPVTLALGDNIFLGGATSRLLREAFRRPAGATLFAVPVPNPEAFGIVTLDADGRALALEEKPRAPQSNQAVTGLYVYDGEAPAIAASIKPSARGELEITDVNREYLARAQVWVERLPEGETWFDSGTPDSLIEASLQVRRLEAARGRKLACLEAIALESGWITAEAVRAAARRWSGSAYGRALETLIEGQPARETYPAFPE